MKKSWLITALPFVLLAAPLHAKDADAEARQELESARQELQQARDELKRAAAELARVTREQGRESPRAQAFAFMADENRGVLGIILGRGPSKEGKLSGVKVDAVTPGSGAEKAGLKSGDVIVAVNGKPLAQTDTDDARPGQKLRSELDELKVGDTVKLGYEREGKRAEASVTAGRPEPMLAPERVIRPLPVMSWLGFDDEEEQDIVIPRGPREERRILLRNRALKGFDFAPLDENLAPYFKTKEGILVTRAAPDNKLGLKSGDVIQKLNGDKVNKPHEAMEKLAELEPGAEVRLDILRQGKAETLKSLKPQDAPERHGRRIERRIEIHEDDAG